MEKELDRGGIFMMEGMAKEIEGLADADLAWRMRLWKDQDPAVWEDLADKYYTRLAVANLPKIVDRFLKLAPVFVRPAYSTELNVYLQEAGRCYIFGLPQASIALARTALETALNNELIKRLTLLDPKWTLEDRIKYSEKCKIISAPMAHTAQDVRRLANKVLHDKPVTDGAAFDCLIQVRAVIGEIYEKPANKR